jgi:hypothetical protein
MAPMTPMTGMSDFLPELIVVLGFLAFGGVLVVLWRQSVGLERLAGGDRLARDRERHDHYRLISQLAEKLHAPESFELARTHAQERTTQSQLDAALERERSESIRGVQDNRAGEPEYLPPGQDHEGAYG